MNGQVTGEDRAAIEGANVLLTRVPAIQRDAQSRLRLKAGEVEFSANVRTDRNGWFQAAIPPGRYHLCAEVEAKGYLGSYVWSGMRTIDIGAQGLVLTPGVVLKRGVTLQVEFADTAGLTRPAGLAPNLAVAIRDTSSGMVYDLPYRELAWEPVYVIPRAPDGRILGERVPAPGQVRPRDTAPLFQRLVPTGKQMDLLVIAKGLSLRQNGQAVPLNTPAARIQTGLPSRISFTVGPQ